MSVDVNKLSTSEQAKIYIYVYEQDLASYYARLEELEKANKELDKIYYDTKNTVYVRMTAMKEIASNSVEMDAIEWSIKEIESKIERLIEFAEEENKE